MDGATFLAMRMTLGLTVEDAAELFDVRRRTIRHWQTGAVPDGVAEELADMMEAFDARVGAAVDRLEETYKELEDRGMEAPPLVLPQWASQEDYDEAVARYGIDPRSRSLSNAEYRAVAVILRYFGREVTFVDGLEYHGMKAQASPMP